MSSGFITESELAEARKVRQAEWERVRTDDQPLEAPEELYDPRPLYQRLDEQKQKKDAEYEETHKLKNMIRGLDDDEVGFLDLVERTKATAARQISLEEQREMQEFRERVSTLQESAETKRLAQQLAEPTLKKPASNANSTRSKLQGMIVRKRKISDTDPQENGPQNGLSRNGPVEKTAKHDPIEKTAQHDPAEKTTKHDPAEKTAKHDPAKNGVTLVNGTDNSASGAGAMKCVAVLPGLGHYGDDTSDSENSSDSDECQPQTPAYDLCGRRHEKKKEEESKS